MFLPEFLSTLSLRRATAASRGLRFPPLDFYPRSPCGERPGCLLTMDTPNIFLSTLSLRRATLWPRNGKKQHNNFYPRSPCGERRKKAAKAYSHQLISIHALLAESDSVAYILSIVRYISIHALLAESDRQHNPKHKRPAKFLSTLSLRRATKYRSSDWI